MPEGWHKNELTRLTILTLSITISTAIAILRSWVDTIYDNYIISFLLVIFLVVFTLRVFSDSIANYLWRRKMNTKFKSPIVAILREPQCENNLDGHPFTTFLSDDWNDWFVKHDLQTEIITIDQIDDKYTFIINPYGEVYPEKNPITLETFNKIIQYITKGGIFVCAAGIAFFYCWDSKTQRRIVLAKEIYPLGPNPPPNPQNILYPMFPYPPIYSILETPLKEQFGVLTTGGTSRPNTVTYQMNEDIRYVGNLSNVGGTDQIVEFRSATPSTRRCIPLLRADLPSFGEVYPIAGIPYEKGLLIVNGFDLVDNTQVGNIHLRHASFEKICTSITSILNGIQRNLIPYDWSS